MVTPPLNGLILPGVVRNSLLAISREWNQFDVSERNITMKEVMQLLSENRVRGKKDKGKKDKKLFALPVSPCVHYRNVNSLAVATGDVWSGYCVCS